MLAPGIFEGSEPYDDNAAGCAPDKRSLRIESLQWACTFSRGQRAKSHEQASAQELLRHPAVDVHLLLLVACLGWRTMEYPLKLGN